MSVINYAVEVVTEFTSESQVSLGLVAGTFRYITGRPGYDGTPSYPLWEDDTNNTAVWYEGWIMKNGLGIPSRQVDILETGDYGALSGFNFTIRNDDKMWSYIRDREIFLTNRAVKLYVVIDDKFYQIWTGVISNNPYDEINYEFTCIDKFKTIHKPIPPEPISQTNYPGSISESQGESIPVCIGDITYAKLQTLQVEPDIMEVNNASFVYGWSYPTKAMAAIKYDTTSSAYPEVTVYTTNRDFVEDELANKYIFCTKGGGNPDTDQLVLIHSNTTTSSGLTTIQLEDTFEDTTDTLFNKYYTIDPGVSPESIDNGDFSFGATGDMDDSSIPDAWMQWDNLDMSNNGIGCNVLQLYIRAEQTFFVEVHLGDIDGEVIGRMHINLIGTELYRLHINNQTGSDVSITLAFRDAYDNPYAFNISTWNFNWMNLAHTTSCDDTWWLSVTDMDNNLIASNYDIESFERDGDYGKVLLFTYDAQKKEMISASHLIKLTNGGLTGATGHPQISLLTSKIQKDGSLKYKVPFTPSAWNAKIHNNRGWILHNGNQIYNLNDVQARESTSQIADRSQLTSLDFHVEYPGSTVHPVWNKREYSMYVNVAFPENHVQEEYDELYMALDIDVDCSTEVKIVVGMDVLDSYGSVIVETFPNFTERTDPRYPAQIVYPVTEEPEESTFTVNMLPPEFYEQGGTTEPGYESDWKLSDDDADGEVTTLKSMLSINSDIINAIRDGFSSNMIKLTITVLSNGLGTVGDKFTGDISVKQIGFLGIKSVSILSDTFYARIKGELIDGEETNSVYNAFRLMLERYDGIDSSDIDYGNLPTTRNYWPVGRQLIERKNSSVYLKELCMHSFVSMFANRLGNRALSAWRESPSPTLTYNETNIVADSVKFFRNSEIHSLYNDFRLWYARNPATNTFDQCLYITNVDQDAFPDIDEMLTNPPIAKWKTFVGGLSENSYVDAKKLWETCHRGYVQAAAVQEAPKTVTNLFWYTDSQTFSGVSTTDNQGIPTVSVKDSPYLFLKNLVEWTTRQKSIVGFSVPIVPNVDVELLDQVTYNDSIFTDSSDRTGWVTSISINPSKDTIDMQLTLDPVVVVDNLYIEEGIYVAPDTMPESGTEADQVDDGQER